MNVCEASIPTRRRRQRTTGGVSLGQDSSREAKRLAAAILEVLAGGRTPTQGAQALAVSLPRYYQVEARGLRGLLAACEPKPRGRQSNSNAEVVELRPADAASGGPAGARPGAGQASGEEDAEAQAGGAGVDGRRSFAAGGGNRGGEAE
jgi:hypothetical protein